jgi:tripartite ATP-independent transporter DctP family solute receptor
MSHRLPEAAVMKMKGIARSRSLVLAAFCSASLPAAGGCRAGHGQLRREYRLQVNVGSTTYWGMGAARFSELVASKTKGRINVKPYYGSQLLKGAQLNSSQMVSSGAIDCAFESTINAAPVFPEMNVFSMPFFINTYENLDKLENGETGRKIFAAMRAKGLEPLAWGENGFRQLTNSRRPVRTPDDLEGLRIRVVGSPIFIDIFRHLDADPINMNWGDAVTALQQGTVDGQENPAGILTAVGIHQFNRFCTLWNYAVDPLIIYWNKKQYDAFPPELRRAIQEAALQAGRFEKALCRAGLDGKTSIHVLKQEFEHEMEIPDPMAYLEENGMEVYPLSEENIDAFRERLRPVFDKWVERIGADIIRTASKDMGAGPSGPPP